MATALRTLRLNGTEGCGLIDRKTNSPMYVAQTPLGIVASTSGLKLFVHRYLFFMSVVYTA